MKNILFISDLELNGRNNQRLNDLLLYHNVYPISLQSTANIKGIIDYIFIKLKFPLSRFKLTYLLLNILINQIKFDIIWLDKAERISLIQILIIKFLVKSNSNKKIIWFCEDNILNINEINLRYSYIFLFSDIILTTKVNVYRIFFEYKFNKISYFPNTINNFSFNSFDFSNQPCIKESNSVIFIGSFEKDRWEKIRLIVSNKICVTIFGNGWSHLKEYSSYLIINSHLNYHQFLEVIPTFKISLNFFRKSVNDTMTSRPIELAAFSACIVSEYSDEISQIFTNNRDIVYFYNDKDLISSIKYLLNDDQKRSFIKNNSYRISKKYTFHDHIRNYLEE